MHCIKQYKKYMY